MNFYTTGNTEIWKFWNMVISTFVIGNYLLLVFYTAILYYSTHVTGNIFDQLSTDPIDLFLPLCVCCTWAYGWVGYDLYLI